MLKKIFPSKLKGGDTIAVIAPSCSFSILSPETIKIANTKIEEMNLRIELGKNIQEIDHFNSSSIASRIDDLHWAFGNSKIKAILTVIGGYNSNQLLKFIDWKIIRDNPKIFCGYSDITALSNAIYAKTGLVTYSGPHYSSFGQKINCEYTIEYFKKCLFSDSPYTITSSANWSDDAWYLNQNNVNLNHNSGPYAINYGQASGTLIGGNLTTLRILQGTEYFPSLENSILLLEDDYETNPQRFDRDLQSLLLLPDFKKIRGLVIGRFQRNSHIFISILKEIISTKSELKNIPIIADVDFGHTSPMATFPIGGEVTISASKDTIDIIITKH